MDVQQIGEIVPTRLVGLKFYVALESNVREEWLKDNLAEPLSDFLRDYYNAFTDSHAEDDPPRFVRVKVLVGPFISDQSTWRDFRRDAPDYAPEDDPYHGESVARYEDDERGMDRRQARWEAPPQ